jgi:hypothetical protein
MRPSGEKPKSSGSSLDGDKNFFRTRMGPKPISERPKIAKIAFLGHFGRFLPKKGVFWGLKYAQVKKKS